MRAPARGNPFLSHAFLSALEDSGSVGGPLRLAAAPPLHRRSRGQLAAVLPAYAKTHSQGEYVFDHAWSDAYERAGGDYYPKLQIAVPFTPVPGRRLLTRDPALAPALLAAAETLVTDNGLSSAHATFIDGPSCRSSPAPAGSPAPIASSTGTMTAMRAFDDFLAALASRKRKAIRKEREAAVEGLAIAASKAAT
jgi:predicted N-acyltransferase